MRDNRHDSACLFGAVCPAGAAIVMPFVSSEAMSGHLAEIATQVSVGAHAVLVRDGAGRHQSGERLIVPDNITLLRLPPCAARRRGRRISWKSGAGAGCTRTSCAACCLIRRKSAAWDTAHLEALLRQSA